MNPSLEEVLPPAGLKTFSPHHCGGCGRSWASFRAEAVAAGTGVGGQVGTGPYFCSHDCLRDWQWLHGLEEYPHR